jgi:hypothetical protein
MMKKFENHFEVFFISQKHQFEEQPNQLNDTNAKDILVLNPNFISTLGYLKLEPSEENKTISFAKAGSLETNYLYYTDFIINSQTGNYGFIYNQLYIENLFDPKQFPSLELLMSLPIKLSKKIGEEILVIRIKKNETNNSTKFKVSQSLNSGKIDYGFKLIMIEALTFKIVEILKNDNIDKSEKINLILNLDFEKPAIVEQLNIIQNAQSIAEKQVEIYQSVYSFFLEKQSYLSNLQPK